MTTKRTRRPASIQAVQEAIVQYDQAQMWRQECFEAQCTEIILAREALEAQGIKPLEAT